MLAMLVALRDVVAQVVKGTVKKAFSATPR
jgi:hypothetical protein